MQLLRPIISRHSGTEHTPGTRHTAPRNAAIIWDGDHISIEGQGQGEERGHPIEAIICCRPAPALSPRFPSRPSPSVPAPVPAVPRPQFPAPGPRRRGPEPALGNGHNSGPQFHGHPDNGIFNFQPFPRVFNPWTNFYNFANLPSKASKETTFQEEGRRYDSKPTIDVNRTEL